MLFQKKECCSCVNTYLKVDVYMLLFQKNEAHLENLFGPASPPSFLDTEHLVMLISLYSHCWVLII